MAKMVVNLEFIRNSKERAEYYKVTSTTGCIEVEIAGQKGPHRMNVRPGTRIDPMDVGALIAVSHAPDSNLTVNIK